MKRNILTLLLGAIALPACSAYQPQPLSPNHPAHGDAALAPRQAPSLTLAYTRADIPSSPTLLSAVPEIESGGTSEPKIRAEQTATGEGKVVATVPGAGQLVVEHGEIKGFMDAMTMGYRVEPPSLMGGVKVGDKVRFTIDVPKKAIIKLEKVN